MTTSPPDISSLTLTPQRARNHDGYEQQYDNRFQHFQTSPAIVPSPGQRRGLPAAWLETQNTPVGALPGSLDGRSLSPGQPADDLSSGGGSPPNVSNLAGQAAGAHVQSLGINDDEVIPTAIVIKNIPFSVKRETLLDIIASLNIPTPYAFNYHLDPMGQFRGLAFANFRVAADADAVVAALNGFDVQGRKLRVEYKKVLQPVEKERIEREKAIRRMRSMQLEKEQHLGAVTPGVSGYDDPMSYGPIHAPPISQSRSFSGALPMGTPTGMMPSMPIPQPYPHHATPPPLISSMTTPNLPTQKSASLATELDLNDPATLDIYSRILLFKDDPMRDELAFSRSLSPKQRRIVHLVAQKLGVYHYSLGEGDDRYAVVTRREPERNGASGAGTPSGERIGPIRHHSSQALSRSFLSPSASNPASNPFAAAAVAAASSPTSSGLYSQSSAAGSNSALRSKKSMPDMKSLYTPQPRLTTRSSNGNIREGYATFSSPIRRTPTGTSVAQLFGPGTGGGSIPTVPELGLGAEGGPPTPGGGLGSANVVRQPRGPGIGGFMRRRESGIGPGELRRVPSGGLDARTHEPLEI